VKGLKKPEATRPEVEDNSALDSNRDDIPHSALNNSEIEIPTSEIKTMEVHHHPDLHHQPKPWKEYLLEGLMIFMAVTMGFFAESFRENLVSKEKERHYIDNIVDDLKKDTADVTHALFEQGLLNDKMDKALSIPVDRIRNIQTQDIFYKNFTFFYAWIETFDQNDNTYTQLKNAGGFSVIHERSVIDSISWFYNYYAVYLKGNNNWYITTFSKTNDIAVQLIKLPAPPMTMKDTAFAIIPKKYEVFTRYDEPMLEELYSNIRYEKGTLLYLMKIETDYKTRAAGLIKFLQTEYK